MLVPIRKHKIKTNIHNWSGLESTDQNSEKPMFGNATPMHANFKNFFRIVTIDVKMNSEKFRSISQRLAILQDNR